MNQKERKQRKRRREKREEKKAKKNRKAKKKKTTVMKKTRKRKKTQMTRDMTREMKTKGMPYQIQTTKAARMSQLILQKRRMKVLIFPYNITACDLCFNAVKNVILFIFPLLFRFDSVLFVGKVLGETRDTQVGERYRRRMGWLHRVGSLVRKADSPKGRQSEWGSSLVIKS